MNDSDEIWQIKRGRPRKLLQDEYLKLNAYFKQSMTTSEHQYRKAKNIYLSDCYTLKIENLIVKILSMFDLPYEVKHLPLLIIAQESAKQMLISEMELIVFAIILLKNNIAESNLHPEELIKICFFHSKLIMESDFGLIQTIRENLNNDIIDFETKLVSISGINAITLKKINKWSKRLKEWKIVTINYSYYVDSIMLKAPPYKVGKTHKNQKIGAKSMILNKTEIKGDLRKIACKEVLKVDFGHMVPKKNSNKKIKLKETLRPIVEAENDYWYPKEDNEYGLDNLE